MEKKGQFGNLPTTVFIIIMALTFLVIGIFLVQEIYDFDEFTDNSATVYNETVRLNSSNEDTLERSTTQAFNTPVIVRFTNSTSGALIDNANATVNEQGVIKNVTNGVVSDSVNVTYTYQYGGSSYAGINSTTETFADIPGYLNLLILVVMIGIIIAVLIGFGGRRINTGA